MNENIIKAKYIEMYLNKLKSSRVLLMSSIVMI